MVQAVRLAYLSAERLAFVEGHPIPDPAAIDVTALVGSVLHERDSGIDTESDPDPDAEPEGELDLFGEY